MVKYFITAFLLSFVGSTVLIGLFYFLPQYAANQWFDGKVPFMAQVETPPQPTPSPTPDLTPVTLIIPKLGIQTAVEHVGLTETNNMEVPENADNVAWYIHGPKPSEKGNAVIAGHYDTPTGRPAIFYKLKTLEPGDEVEVISSNAVRTTFTVTEVSTIPYDVFPSDEVFVTREGVNLNLITCGGIWDARKKTYLDRIVVYTTVKTPAEKMQELL